MKDEREDEDKLDLELDAKTAEGVYSNLCVVNHSTSEFVIDFVSFMPGIPKAKVCSRLILPPENAKRLLSSLAENISNYEREVSEIETDEHVAMNFGPLGKA